VDLNIVDDVVSVKLFIGVGVLSAYVLLSE
jgi:hypothetical protein